MYIKIIIEHIHTFDITENTKEKIMIKDMY